MNRTEPDPWGSVFRLASRDGPGCSGQSWNSAVAVTNDEGDESNTAVWVFVESLHARVDGLVERGS